MTHLAGQDSWQCLVDNSGLYRCPSRASLGRPCFPKTLEMIPRWGPMATKWMIFMDQVTKIWGPHLGSPNRPNGPNSWGGGTHVATTSEAKHFVLLEEKGAGRSKLDSFQCRKTSSKHRSVDPFKIFKNSLSKMIYCLHHFAVSIEKRRPWLCVFEASPRECGGSLQRLEQWQRQLSRIPVVEMSEEKFHMVRYDMNIYIYIWIL